MKNMARTILAVTVLSTIVFAGTAQAPKAVAAAHLDSTTTIRFVWWGNPERNKRTIAAVKLFEKEHPNIIVKTEFAPWDGYWDKISTEISGGNPPDVMQMDIGYIREYADRGALLDLKKLGIIKTSDITPSLLQSGYVDGQLVGIPNAENSFALLYDPKMLAKIGVHIKPGERLSWGQLANISQLAAKKLGKGFYGITDTSANTDLLNYYVRQHKGESLYNVAGTALNVPKKTLVDFLQYGANLRKTGAAPPENVTAGITDIPQSPLVLGKSPFDFAWDNQFVAYEQLANRPLAMMQLPTLPGGQEGQFLDPSQYWSIPSQSQHPKEAAMLVNYLLNDVGAGKLLGAERGLPPSMKVRAAIKPLMGQADQAVFTYEDLVTHHSRPIDPAPPKENDQILFKDYVNIEQEVAYSKKTPAEAADEFLSQASQVFSSGQ